MKNSQRLKLRAIRDLVMIMNKLNRAIELGGKPATEWQMKRMVELENAYRELASQAEGATSSTTSSIKQRRTAPVSMVSRKHPRY
jgi:hypothetical protein